MNLLVQMAEEVGRRKDQLSRGIADSVRPSLCANGLEGHDPIWLCDCQWRPNQWNGHSANCRTPHRATRGGQAPY